MNLASFSCCWGCKQLARSRKNTGKNGLLAPAVGASNYLRVPNYQGWSGILALPYRIQANEPLVGFVIDSDPILFRVYPPFLRRPKSGPITDDVPIQLWPNFSWHPEVPRGVRESILEPINVRYGQAVLYDGVRVDLLRSEKSDPMLPFMQRSMRWLRVISGQPWISDVDHHFEHTLKRVFKIDFHGRATDQIHPVAQMRGFTAVRLVTNEMWKAAFEAAVYKGHVPVYWNLLFDAINAVPADDYARSVMTLAMALESCRDENFAKVHPSKTTPGKGPKLSPPFDHDDLLRHLSDDSSQVFKRSFATEMPQHWTHLKNLYIARHHVAHGKRAVFPEGGRLTVVAQKTYEPLRAAARAAIVWMEQLSGGVIHPLVPIEEVHTTEVTLFTA